MLNINLKRKYRVSNVAALESELNNRFNNTSFQSARDLRYPRFEKRESKKKKKKNTNQRQLPLSSKGRIFKIHQLFSILSSLSYPDQSFDEKTTLGRSSICMEIKINGWIFIHFISPPIFILRLFTQLRIRYSIAVLSLLFNDPSYTPGYQQRNHENTRSFEGSTIHDPRHYWLTLPSWVFNGPVRNSISSGAIDRIYPTLRIISLQNCTRGLFFLLSFSFSTGCSSLRALFQLSGSGSGKEITKIPIFIRSFTSKIQSYLVSFRMVHV